MCTLSVIPTPRGYRVVCNRDESRGRPAAAPPRWRTLDGSNLRAIWPTDTLAGGTWIAASARGLTLALLNLNRDEAPDVSGGPGVLSRGLVIPSLIEQADAESAMLALARLERERFAPFRLIAIDCSTPHQLPRVVEASWDRSLLSVIDHPRGAACFASSGLGDSLVAPRLEVFREMVIDRSLTPEAQDRFHAHRWDDRPELSVLMSRDEARTVSITTVEVAAAIPRSEVHVAYLPVPEAAAVSASA